MVEKNGDTTTVIQNVTQSDKNYIQKATATSTDAEEDTDFSSNNDGLRPSIKLYMIRHAESRNNEIYRDARYIYKGGTAQFDLVGWQSYIDQHRTSDPSLSKIGHEQAQLLANYLTSTSHNVLKDVIEPINIITSPMRRTCETIRPTIQKLVPQSSTSPALCTKKRVNVLVHGFYFESEGCHTNNIPEHGMNPKQIKKVLLEGINLDTNNETSDTNGTTTAETTNEGEQYCNIAFAGFPTNDDEMGWYSYGTGPETRAESEQRASKFYCWLCDYLDEQLYNKHTTKESIPDNTTTTTTTNHHRNVQFLIGHGDFMSLVLKRIVSGFGYAIETIGTPHRSAFVHWNTGITELEYFGHGRFLVMHHNATPHIVDNSLLTGGSLKDGWSYLMPSVLNAEVSVAFSDEELDDHVIEQRNALKALYLSSKESDHLLTTLNRDCSNSNDLLVEDDQFDAPVVTDSDVSSQNQRTKHFIVKRGLQVVGVATYSEQTGHVFDVAVRPSAGKDVAEVLFQAVKNHTKTIGRSGSLVVFPRTEESKRLFESVGFEEVDGIDTDQMELI